ncbi:hypothetical protein MN1_630 [Thermus phage MN1]|nr:hypothetical protein MN1_630 [Thermus phage MN1]
MVLIEATPDNLRALDTMAAVVTAFYLEAGEGDEDFLTEAATVLRARDAMALALGLPPSLFFWSGFSKAHNRLDLILTDTPLGRG